MKDFKEIIETYRNIFSENKFVDLVKTRASKVGTKALYTGLLLFHSYRRNETPIWAKNIIIGTLGYLITPIDLIPDLTPVLGYTDDLGVLSFGLVTIASYINKEVKEKATLNMDSWFPKWNREVIESVDQLL